MLSSHLALGELRVFPQNTKKINKKKIILNDTVLLKKQKQNSFQTIEEVKIIRQNKDFALQCPVNFTLN